MIKKKINKVVNSKYFNILLIAVINLIFFIICNKLFAPKYEQVDDFIIMNLISKMDGAYNIFGVQMHPIICGIIILLYETGININWYTIFLLSMQFISFTIIGTIFVNKNKSLGIPLYIAFIFIMYSKMLSFIQYTTVSMLCITAGFMLLMYSLENIVNIKKRGLILAFIMIITGCLIRFSTIIIGIPFIILYLVCKLIKDKDIKILKLSLILILGIVSVNVSFNIIYNLNPIYKEFLEFHDVRTYLHDYNWMTYENNEEIFNSLNWSENDRDILYAYCFGDENVFNTESLEKIRENALSNQEDIKILYRCINAFKEFTYSVESRIYKFIFLVTAMLVVCNNLSIILNKSINEKKDSMKLSFANLTFIGIVITHCLFIFLSRPMFRVIISIYIIGIGILMYLLLDKIKENNKQITKYTFIVFILIISIFELKQNVYSASFYDKDNYYVYKEVIEYTNSHKENAYLYTLTMHDRFLAYSVYEKIEDNAFSNVRPIGDWDTYTKNYYDFKERYNLDNLIKNLYKKDNVYLISGDVIWGEDYKEYINIVVKYIKEHYGIDVKCKVIKEFDNNINIYKLQEK